MLPQQSAQLRIAIIGAGIVGVTLAHALLARGIPVTVYEASSSIRTTGGGINATEAGVRALKLCGPKCYEAFKQVATTHNRVRPHIFWYVTQDDKVAEIASWEEYGSMKRERFLEALAARLPEDVIKFDSRLSRIGEPDRGVELTFENARTDIVDVLLGCDGLHSKVKGDIVGVEDYRVSYSQTVICRGSVAAKDVEAIVGTTLGRGSQVGIGDEDGFVLYPVNEDLVNMGYFYREPEQQTRWPRPVHEWSKDGLLDHMKNKGARPKHIALAELFPEILNVWSIKHQANPLPTYSKGNIAVLGDAAHAMGEFE